MLYILRRSLIRAAERGAAGARDAYGLTREAAFELRLHQWGADQELSYRTADLSRRLAEVQGAALGWR